jgi:hypothetical protein
MCSPEKTTQKKPETKPGKNAAFEKGGWLFNNKDPMLICK